MARSQPQNFGAFFEDYGELHRLIASLIRQGIAAEKLRAVNPEAAATAALSLNEGLQRHHRQPLPGVSTTTSDDVATLSADTTLASLLRAQNKLPKVRVLAEALAAPSSSSPNGS